MMRLHLILFWLTLGWLPWAVQGQGFAWQEVLHIRPQEVALLDLNNKGHIFCADQEGNLIQYNESGDSINHYSPTIQGELDQLQMSRTVNLFTFSRVLQRYEILDRFLNPVFSGNFNHEDIGLVRAASLGNNHILWLFDETDFSLKQYDYRRNRILQRQPLQLFLDGPHLSILEILEYQNLLFVRVENKGIYLFDNQGNFVHSILIPTRQKLALYKNKFFLVDQGQLVAVDYLSGKKQYIPLPDPSYQNVAIDKSRVIFYGKDFIKAYALNPKLLE